MGCKKQAPFLAQGGRNSIQRARVLIHKSIAVTFPLTGLFPNCPPITLQYTTLCSSQRTHTHTHTHVHTHTHTHTHTHYGPHVNEMTCLISCPACRSEEHTSELQSHVNLVC